MQKKKHKPGLLWITGLSGSGKTTISKMIYKNLKKNYSNIILLDGDKLRDKLKIKPSGSFSYSFRTKVGLQYVSHCNEYINYKNKFVIIAVIALISKVQQYRKLKIIMMFLDVPMNVLEKGIKKLYKRFRNKEIKNMSGLDLKFDKPKKPSLHIKWKKNLTAYKISRKILKLIS